MDRLHLMTVFVAVAEEEGFAAAARRLKMSPPAVTRAIAALEERLGVVLLNRTTRYVRTTDAGHHYLQDARRILAEVEAADEAAAGIHAMPRGELSITAPAMFGRMFVTPVIVEYMQRYPDVNVSALFLDRVVNLVEEGLDLGVRIGELPDSTLRAIRVGEVRDVICASPAYLEQFGEPQTPEDLQQHRIIVSSAGSRSPHWSFGQGSDSRTVKLNPRFTVTLNDAAIEAAKAEFGITRVLSYQVAEALEAGELKVLLSDFEPQAHPIHIVHQQGRNLPAKVRAFIDLAVETLRPDETLQ